MKYKIDNEFPTTIGVYLISFEGSNKVYIGSTAKVAKYKCNSGFRQRWNTHLNVLNRQKGGPALQAAYNKYGKDSIYFVVIEECIGSLGFILEREQYYICKYNSYELGYNSSPYAGSILGIKRSEELKEKLSDIHKKRGQRKAKKYEQKVLSMYNAGLSCKQIRDKLKISKHLVKKILDENNVQIRNSTDYRKQKIYAYSKDKLIKVFDSIKDCADYFETTLVLVSQVINGRAKTSKGRVYSTKKLTKKQLKQKFIRKKHEARS